MIDHLIQRQDVEDRKQILLMATNAEPPKHSKMTQDEGQQRRSSSPIPSDGKLMGQKRQSTQMIDQAGTSEVVFKNEHDTVLTSIEVPTVKLSNQNIKVPLHELPKYNPAEKRRSRYSSTKMGLTNKIDTKDLAKSVTLSIDRNCQACSGNNNMDQ